MSAPPDVAFDYDTRFVQLEVLGDRRDWAAKAAAAAFNGAGRRAGRRDVKRLAGILGTLAQQARALGPIGAFALVPEPWTGVTTVVRVTAVDVGRVVGRDELIAELTVPAQNQAEQPDTGTLDTAAGMATWLLQRIVRPPATSVTETVQILWHFPAEQAALVLSTGFTDLIEAARWRPVLFDLARSISVVPDAGGAG